MVHPDGGGKPPPYGVEPTSFDNAAAFPRFFDKIQKKIECFSNLRCTIDDRS